MDENIENTKRIQFWIFIELHTQACSVPLPTTKILTSLRARLAACRASDKTCHQLDDRM